MGYQRQRRGTHATISIAHSIFANSVIGNFLFVCCCVIELCIAAGELSESLSSVELSDSSVFTLAGEGESRGILLHHSFNCSG